MSLALMQAHDAARYLDARRASILEQAGDAVAERAPRYRACGPEVVQARLDDLFTHLVDALRTGEGTRLLAHARDVARARHESGHDLSEVQAAYNACEEAIWARVFADGDPRRYVTILSYVSAALGGAKDALAQEYVRRAASVHAPALDLGPVVAGLERP